MMADREAQVNGKSPAIHTNRPAPKQTLPQHLIRDPFYVIPHVDTYSGYMNASNQSYYIWADQSQRDSIQNSLAMKRDGFVYELLRHRQLPIVGIPHHVAVDDQEDPDQKSIADVLSAIVSDIPRLGNLKLTLSEAIFYGKMGVQTRIGPRRVMGNTWNSIDNHISINGDKFRFKWDGTPGIVIRAGSENGEQPTYSDNSILHRYKDYVEQTMLGPALFLTSPFLRDRFILHFFEPSDSDYLFEIEESQSIFGLGLRSRYYWLWNMRVELLSWMLDALQRVGANGMLYAMYPISNLQARNQVIDALRQLVKDNVAAFPVDPTNQNYKDIIQRIEPSSVGYEVMMELINHLEEIMRRGILGQDLSSKSKPTGIGKGASDLQGDVREDYIIYDANSLYETLDDQLLKVILRYNYFLYRGKRVRGDDLPFSARLKAQVDKRNVQEQIEAAEKLFNMGIELDKDDVRDVAGFSPPKKRHSALINPQIKAAMQQFEAGVPGIQRAGSDFKSLVSGITQKAGAAGLFPAPAGMGGGGQGGQGGQGGGSHGNGQPARFAKCKAPEDTICLAGELYQSKSGWGLLRVPNALVRGIFDAIREPGLTLAPQDSDKPKSQWKLNAHISVIRPEEVKKAGGPDVITEWGHHFHYQIGPIKKVKPAGWDAMKEVYFVDVESPELEELREKYGLSRLPNNGKYRFHISVAVRLKNQRGKPARFARAGDADDCGHEREGGEFAEGNECAGSDKENADKGEHQADSSTGARLGEIPLSHLASEAGDYVDQVPALEPGDEPGPVIVEQVGQSSYIVDGFHRVAGMLKWCRDEGVDPDQVTVDVVIADDPKLIAAAAEPGPRQRRAIEMIYARAGIGDAPGHFRSSCRPRRFARAGSAEDCGHELHGGEFAEGNTCGGPGGPGESRHPARKSTHQQRVKETEDAYHRQFMANLRKAADAVPEDRRRGSFNHKIWIYDLWNEFKKLDEYTTYDKFKEELIGANRRREIDLLRHDMPQALGREERKTSELSLISQPEGNAEFHQVVMPKKTRFASSRRPARFSRITIPDDAEAISAAQVAVLIADQFRNADDRFSSLDEVIHKFISSRQFHLMTIPTWLPSPYQRIEDDDPAYTTGPIVVDINKRGELKEYNGAFGQCIDISILDGQHRQRQYLNDGIGEIEAYVGTEAIPIIEGLVRDYAPYWEKFKDALERYYTGPGSTTLRGVIDAGKAVGLSLDQTDEIFENFRSGIYFNVNTGEFEPGEFPEDLT
jgi:hypothetical protein